MLKIIRKRTDSREESGFTLIELMVVVLIIAILIAIAIPTFLGARKRAQNRAAQSNLRNALTTEKTWYADKQGFTDVVADLSGIEPNIRWNAGVDAGKNQVTVVSATLTGTNGDRVYMASQSVSKNYYCLAEVANLGTFYYTFAVAPYTPCGDPGNAPVAPWVQTGFDN